MKGKGKKEKLLGVLLAMCILVSAVVPLSIVVAGNTTAEDLAKGATTVSVNLEGGANESSAMAVDGNDSTKWCANIGDNEAMWLVLTFEEAITFNKYYLLSGDGNDPAATTGEALHSAKIQISENGTDWTDVATITNDTGVRGVSGSTDATATTKFVRLYITQPEQTAGANHYLRLYTFELYYGKENLTEKANDVVANFDDNGAASNATDGNDSTKWCANIGDNEALWIVLTYDEAIKFNQYYLLSGDGNDPAATTGEALHSAKIQISENGTDWTDVASITNDTGVRGVSGNLEQTATAKYVRLYVTQPEQSAGNNKYVRLYAFDLYYDASLGTDEPEVPDVPGKIYTYPAEEIIISTLETNKEVKESGDNYGMKFEDLAAGVYKVAYYMTIDSAKDGHQMRISPIVGNYRCWIDWKTTEVMNGHVGVKTFMEENDTNKVILVNVIKVPENGLSIDAGFWQDKEAYVGTLDKVVLATDGYDFINETEYTWVDEKGYQSNEPGKTFGEDPNQSILAVESDWTMSTRPEVDDGGDEGTGDEGTGDEGTGDEGTGDEEPEQPELPEIIPGVTEDLAKTYSNVEANGEYANELGEYAVDSDDTTKWCIGLSDVEDDNLWLMLEFDQAIVFDSYYLLSGDGNDPNYTTGEALYSAVIQISNNGSDWTDVANVLNPDGVRGVIGRLETPAKAKYVRLLVTQPEQNAESASHVRLYSFELYNVSGATDGTGAGDSGVQTPVTGDWNAMGCVAVLLLAIAGAWVFRAKKETTQK